MAITKNPNWFADTPLERLNIEKDNQPVFDAARNDPDSLLLPLYNGDPLVIDGKAGFLSMSALEQFPDDAPLIFLGLEKGRAYFTVDVSSSSPTPEDAPFGNIGEYMNARAAAGVIGRTDTAILGQARWLLEWRKSHRFCSACGGALKALPGGTKQQCTACGLEHFPRTDPVAIVLALHGDACLLGRGPQWPEGFVSALAGFVEPAETPEEAAKREVFEEAGVRINNVRYQFSQPWPFPSSLMMGFIAEAEGRELTLDKDEIVHAVWLPRAEAEAMIRGEQPNNYFFPPEFTIARQLIEHWVRGASM